MDCITTYLISVETTGMLSLGQDFGDIYDLHTRLTNQEETSLSDSAPNGCNKIMVSRHVS